MRVVYFCLQLRTGCMLEPRWQRRLHTWNISEKLAVENCPARHSPADAVPRPPVQGSDSPVILVPTEVAGTQRQTTDCSELTMAHSSSSNAQSSCIIALSAQPGAGPPLQPPLVQWRRGRFRGTSSSWQDAGLTTSARRPWSKCQLDCCRPPPCARRSRLLGFSPAPTVG